MSWYDSEGLTLITAPAVEPLDIEDAKAACRILHDGLDSNIDGLIKGGRERCERITNRALVSQQWKLTLGKWPSDYIIRLPKPPLISVDSVKYANLSTGVLTTLATSQYFVDATTEPATITPATLSSGVFAIWPIPRIQRNAIEVTFTAGYGTSPDNVPNEIKERLKVYVAHCLNRQEETDEEYLDRIFAGFSSGTFS